MPLPFTKMHALGNDFMILDCVEQNNLPDTKTITQWADRHRGVGFDQLLVLTPSHLPQVDFGYRIFNADGSEVNQCGNGARCLALYARAHHLPPTARQCVLATPTDELVCVYEGEQQVAVHMPEPAFTLPEIPFEVDRPTVFTEPFTLVAVGNPHAVVSVTAIDSVDLSAWGEKITADSRFVQGVNLSIVQRISDSEIHLRVYERGAGPTQACGSAACAAAAVGIAQGQLTSRVRVRQPGGDLTITWQGLGHPIEMLGEGIFVYHGYIIDSPTGQK